MTKLAGTKFTLGQDFRVTDRQVIELSQSATGSVSVLDYGAKGDGVADDTAAIQAAIASLGAAGGRVEIPSGMRCLIDSNLTVNANVTLEGPHAIVGSPNNNTSAPYGSVGGALLVNSSATITLKGGAALQGLLIYRKGMTFPAADSSAFAGAAVTIGGDDAAVFQCMILGFAQAITSSGWQRPRIYDCNIDCGSGILINNCADIVYLNKVHCWPFATIAAGGGASSLQRGGTAFKFTNLNDWSKVTDCFSYGYFRGYWNSGANSMTFSGCGADNTGSHTGSIGFLIESAGVSGGEDTRLIGCQAAAQENGYYINTVAGIQTRLIGSDLWGCTNHGVLINAGDVHVIGGVFRDVPNAITVNNGTSQSYVDEVRFDNNIGLPVNVTVSNSSVHIGLNNNYAGFSDGAVVTSNTYRVVRSVTSADPLNLPVNGDFFQVTGNTNFGTLNGGWSGRRVTLKFTGTPTVLDGGASMKLNGNFAASVNATLTLVHDGVAWCETSRSTN